jgi:signal-transduction protein with cAMP-binding, CBS, and nucleotidyltransferase domain
LIREVSAWALFQINKDGYQQHAKRLGENQKRSLDELILHTRKMLRFEKVLFFQNIKVFESIPGITLSHLAEISDEIRLQAGESLTLDEKSNNNFHVIVVGSVQFFQRGEKIAEFSEGQFIGEMLALPNFVNTNLLIAQTEVSILKFNKDQFYELLSDNVQLADKIIEFI